ncbi:hypothetical protein CR513_31263, partial [Mucuna pruriens]
MGQPTMEEQRVCCVETKKTWMNLFLKYFKRDVVPKDATQARKLMREASKYTFVGKHLYMKCFSFPLLKCLDIDEVKYIISQVGGRALVSKVAKAAYY